MQIIVEDYEAHGRDAWAGYQRVKVYKGGTLYAQGWLDEALGEHVFNLVVGFSE